MPSMYTSGTSDTSGTGHASRSGFPGYSDAGRNPAPNDFGTGTKVIDPANVDTGLCQVLLTVKLFICWLGRLRGGSHRCGQEVVHCFLRDFFGAGVDASTVVVGLDPFAYADTRFEFGNELFPLVE